MRKVTRVEESLEFELLWQKGKIVRRRVSQIRGSWEQEGNQYFRHSEKPRRVGASKLSILELACMRIFKHARCANFKILYVETVKTVNQVNYRIKSYYFEIRDVTKTKTLLLSANMSLNELIAEVEKWISDQRSHDQLPLRRKSYHFDSILLSPSTFGALLHESLGHALEDKDAPRRLGRIKASFDVFDTPGIVGDWGYTPIDDCGHRGKPVKLLNGKRGTFRVLGSGNYRAASWTWHPIIRQRVLEVIPLRRLHNPHFQNTLFIEEANLGMWDDESQTAELLVTQAKLLENGKASYQLPMLKFQCSPQILSYLQCYGEIETCHPGGGCHKDLQRGLPVSFKAPYALLEISKSSQKFFKIFCS